MTDPISVASIATDPEMQRLAISERIAAGEEIDAAQLPAELLAQPAIQRLLQLSRVMQQLGKNQQADDSSAQARDKNSASNYSGDNFGAYRLLRMLGTGGMGEVWLAERIDGLVEHQVAIKRVHGQTTRLMDRLLSERKLLARLSHPGIARFIDAGVDAANAPWLAMEYVDGVTITQWCSERNLGLRERLELFRKVCAAVEHAHRHLIVHRDIKPNNVLVDRDGQPKLLDFGIAKLLDGGSGEFTVNAMTPAYAAPEQLRAEEVSTATDVYALGLLLFRLLAGALPRTRSNENIPAILMRLHLEENERPSAHVAERVERHHVGAELISGTGAIDGAGEGEGLGAGEKLQSNSNVCASAQVAQRAVAQASATLPYPLAALKGDLDAIVAQALRLAPEDRYGSVVEFSADIERYLSAQAVRARAPTRWYLYTRLVQRNWLAFALSGGIVCALIVGASAAFLEAKRAERATTEQAAAAARALAARDFLLDVLRFANPYQSENPSQQLDLLYERAVPLVQEKLGNDPDSAAQILYQFGLSLMALDRAESANSALLSAEQIILTQAQPDKDYLYATRTVLADLARRQRDLNSALTRTDQIAGRCSEVNVEPAECLHSKNLRIETLLFAGQLQQALTEVGAAHAYAKAHDLSFESNGEYVDYLESMTAREFGNSDQAALAIVRSAERTMADAPPTHPGLLTDLMWLAWAASDYGQLDLASRLSDASLQGRAALFGADSRMAMQPRLQQAVLMLMRGKKQRALELLRAASDAIKPSALLRGYEEDLIVWRAIADDDRITNSVLESAERTRVMALGENHIRTADLRLRMCAAYIRRHDLAAASAAFARAQPSLANADARALQPLAMLIAVELMGEKLGRDKLAGDKLSSQIMLANVENLTAKQGRVMYDPIHARMIGLTPTDSPPFADLYRRILMRRAQAHAPGWITPQSISVIE